MTYLLEAEVSTKFYVPWTQSIELPHLECTKQERTQQLKLVEKLVEFVELQ